ncbi:1-acyl-sn-glycerol-3-phosphate acyltransferase [Spraguea lophii 42_110]|uniref:1-acyl-sn-glycerol-3-phosphate acyltransferase n=1 Tax=Spraguea lophii (strain 42_110) TaxID=1358809 RepID=S7XR58_SPRLO|nr:1-acyl-sn-glycerol-3-phosphate acyltransferase [Spraguea lophii 42_110]
MRLYRKGLRKRTFLKDACHFISMNIHSLEDDHFSNCFASIPRHAMDNSGIFYIFSIIIRYLILFPIRLIFFTAGLIMLIHIFLWISLRDNYDLVDDFLMMGFRLFYMSLGINANHHGYKRKMEEKHVYVSNHTSFLDFIILSGYKFPHSSLAQTHTGAFGFFFNFFLKRNGSISFDRSKKEDKATIKDRIKQLVSISKSPLLIFPEGVCVNNKYSVLFQRGAFDLGVKVVPVALNYHKKILDPYWNRRENGFMGHFFYLMSRWRLDVDVHWMEPEEIHEDETAIEFAFRVKKDISSIISLENVLWNGYLKGRTLLDEREILKQAFRYTYMRYIIVTTELRKMYLLAKDAPFPEDPKLFRKNRGKVYFDKFDSYNYLHLSLKTYYDIKCGYLTDPMYVESMILKGERCMCRKPNTLKYDDLLNNKCNKYCPKKLEYKKLN